jgi:hypothetical protein
MEPWRFMIMELAHAGYGSPQVLMDERVDYIMDAYEYHAYRVKFEYYSQLMAEEE